MPAATGAPNQHETAPAIANRYCESDCCDVKTPIHFCSHPLFVDASSIPAFVALRERIKLLNFDMRQCAQGST